MDRRLLPVAVLAAVFASQQAAAADPLPTVPHVDLARYAGKWHEIARIPNRLQSHCASGTTAEHGRRYGWILSRTPALPPETPAAINERLKALGCDPGRFENTVNRPARQARRAGDLISVNTRHRKHGRIIRIRRPVAPRQGEE